MTTFTPKWRQRNADGAHICIGLDPDLSKIPDSVKGNDSADRVYGFTCDIVDATHKYAAAYKPQIAFFEALGGKGHKKLRWVIEHIRATNPAIPVILDFKRADIGNTNRGYVDFAFDYLGVDAVTVNPYFGREALQPFLARADKMIVILCRTSNPGADELQDVSCRLVTNPKTGDVYRNAQVARAAGFSGGLGQAHMPHYQYVARRIVQEWNGNGNCAVVVGATYPEELGLVRDIVGPLPILLPGIGTQGGDLEASFGQGVRNPDDVLIPNTASAVNFAYLRLLGKKDKLRFKPKQFAEAARVEAKNTNRAVAELLPA